MSEWINELEKNMKVQMNKIEADIEQIANSDVQKQNPPLTYAEMVFLKASNSRDAGKGEAIHKYHSILPGGGCSQYKGRKNCKRRKESIQYSEKENINANSFKMHRLGAHDQNKKRRIRPGEALEILKLWNNLRDPEVYKSDQIPAQRGFLKKVLNDMNNKKSVGKSNLRVKYIGGVPTITTISAAKGAEAARIKNGVTPSQN
ncbi:hypothetical protein HHI36_012637 [Cryptolaemus montrouzieri]|uniref:Uncharacterized protein n=1 Tax=Cryptolaemus montrouzieri TaxID=559131 RepID=A0ABD2NG11_9CUCU